MFAIVNHNSAVPFRNLLPEQKKNNDRRTGKWSQSITLCKCALKNNVSHCHTKRHYKQMPQWSFLHNKQASFHHHLDRYSSLVCYHHFCGAMVTENFFWQLFLLFNGRLSFITSLLLLLFFCSSPSSFSLFGSPFFPCLSWQPVVIGFISSSHLSWRSEQTAHLIPQSWRSNNAQINREEWKSIGTNKKLWESNGLNGNWGPDVSETLGLGRNKLCACWWNAAGCVSHFPSVFKLWPFIDGLSVQAMGTHQLSGCWLTYRTGLSGGVMCDGP